MIRVLVADDEPLIAAGIRTVLESAPDISVVASAVDGRSAVSQATAHRVDVVVLDVSMPGLDGLGAAAELRRTLPEARIVFLTAFGVESNVVSALQNDASGFVLKNCTPEELIRAVRAAYAGEAYLSPAVAKLVMGMAAGGDAARRSVAVSRLAALSPRELEVLRLVAEGMSNAEVGVRVHMSEGTIKTYMSRILSKLDCTNRVQAAMLIRDAR